MAASQDIQLKRSGPNLSLLAKLNAGGAPQPIMPLRA